MDTDTTKTTEDKTADAAAATNSATRNGTETVTITTTPPAQTSAQVEQQAIDNAKGNAEHKEAMDEKRVETAERVTREVAEQGRLPETGAIANPAPATEMESPSGAFVEPEIKKAIPVDHPSIDNNPRRGTSAVQNGADFNDPDRRDPLDPKFSGQGLDMSVYGGEQAKAADEVKKD